MQFTFHGCRPGSPVATEASTSLVLEVGNCFQKKVIFREQETGSRRE